METNYNYIDAYNELQQIVSEIESGEVNIDDLSTKIQRASQLILVCKTKLTATENEVESLLAQLHTEEENQIIDDLNDSEEEAHSTEEEIDEE